MLSLLSVMFLSGCSRSFVFVSFERAETLGAAKCLLECYQLFFVQMSKQFPMVIQTNVAGSYINTIIAEIHEYGHSHRNIHMSWAVNHVITIWVMKATE